MTLYIRDDKNRTIWGAEYWVANTDGYQHLEISSSIDVENYSRFLLANQERSDEIINVFDQLSEIRGWMWEVHFMTQKNIGSDKQYSEVLEQIQAKIKAVCKMFLLNYVTD